MKVSESNYRPRVIQTPAAILPQRCWTWEHRGSDRDLRRLGLLPLTAAAFHPMALLSGDVARKCEPRVEAEVSGGETVSDMSALGYQENAPRANSAIASRC